MHRRPWLALAVVAGAALLSLSCVAPCLSPCSTALRRTPRAAAAAAATVPVSQDAATRFEQKTRGMKDDEFRIELTDEEVTSYVALQLGDDPLLTSPQIRFRPGEIVVEGDMTSPIKGHIVLSGAVTIVDGRPRIEFRSARIGAISVPGSVLESMSQSVNETLQESDPEIEIEQIVLLEGRIIVSGRRRQ